MARPYNYLGLLNHPSLSKEHVDEIMRHSNADKPSELASKIAAQVAIGNEKITSMLNMDKHADHLFNVSDEDYRSGLTEKILPHLSNNVISNYVDQCSKQRSFHSEDRDKLNSLAPRFTESHIRSLYSSDHSWPRSVAVEHPKLPKDIKQECLNNGVPETEYGSTHDLSSSFARNPSLTSDDLKRFINPLIGSKNKDDTNKAYDRSQIHGMVQALAHPNMDKNHIKDLLSDSKNGFIAHSVAEDSQLCIPEYAEQIISTHAGNKDLNAGIGNILKRDGAKPEWFDQLFAQRGGKNLPYNFYSSKHTPKHHLERLLSNQNPDQDEEFEMTRALEKSPNVTEEHIARAMKMDGKKFRDVVGAATELSRHHGLYEDPDKVRFAFGTTKLREARAMAEAHPERKIHKKDLEKVGLKPDVLGIQHLQGAKGHITHEALSSHIASQPHHEYGYSHASYGDDLTSQKEELLEEHNSNFDPEEYGVNHDDHYPDEVVEQLNGTHDKQDIRNKYSHLHDGKTYQKELSAAKKIHADKFHDNDQTIHDLYENNLDSQQHNLEPSHVFQLNLTKDHFKKMKEQGVFNTFKDMHQASYASGHPGAEGNGLGWVRYTKANDGVFIDEIQSDFGQSFAKQAVGQLQAKVERGEMMQPEANQHIENFKKRWPEDSYNKIRNIVFGDKEPHEVLHEAFHQHLRDVGHTGKPVHIWHEEGKAPISKMQTRKDENPVWMKQTYNQQPKKMGYKPAKYGELQTQDNPTLKDKPTLAHTLKKARKVLNTLNKTLSKAK